MQIAKDLKTNLLAERRGGIPDGVRTERFCRLSLSGILVFYLVLATGVSLTKIPICDEGWYADPAVNLVRNGYMGSPILEGAGSFLKGIDRYTYWEMPLHIVLQAGWYRVFGTSLFSTRALSIAAGLAVLISWYVIVLQISGSRQLALLMLAFAEIDTIFLALAATGRSDMLSIAFGSMAAASYLLLRRRRFKLALLIAHSFVVASGLTHPIGGLVALGTTLYINIYLDRDRVVFSDILPIAIPYLVGGLAWGLYIMESPTTFWSQFAGNSAQRLWPWKSPMLALKREIVERFIGGYQIGSSSWTALAKVRLFVLLVYLSALLVMLLRPELRRTRMAAIVSAQLFLTSVILVFFEGSKQPWFLIYLLFPFSFSLGSAVNWCWKQQVAWRPTLALIVLTFACIQIGYPALLIAKNNYRNTYCRTVEFIAGRTKEPRSVMGSAELGFGLGFEKVSDDHFLGYYTHKEPSFIVFDPNSRAYLQAFKQDRPEVYQYVQSLLTRRYHEVYSNNYYSVWALYHPEEVEHPFKN